MSKFSIDGRTKWRRNIAENLNRLIGCTNVTDRQTDDRRTDDDIIIANVNVNAGGEFTFAKKHNSNNGI